MNWQDVTVGIVIAIFSVALIPAVRRRQPLPLSSCFITAAGLTVIDVCYFTLGLIFAGVITAVNAFMWWWLTAIAGQ